MGRDEKEKREKEMRWDEMRKRGERRRGEKTPIVSDPSRISTGRR